MKNTNQITPPQQSPGTVQVKITHPSSGGGGKTSYLYFFNPPGKLKLN